MGKLKITQENLQDVRKTFDFGFGEILIYEPTNEMIESYYEFIESLGTPESVSGIDVIRVFVPLFTNLEFDEEFLQENLHKIMEEPPLWFRRIQAEISIIVNELSALKVISLKNTIEQVTVLDNLSEEDIKKYKNINIDSLKNKIDLIDNKKDEEIEKLEKRLKELRG